MQVGAGFLHDIGERIDDIEIVAIPAGKGIRARSAVEAVIAVAAAERVQFR